MNPSTARVIVNRGCVGTKKKDRISWVMKASNKKTSTKMSVCSTKQAFVWSANFNVRAWVLFHVVVAVVQQDPPFPPDMSPTSPLLSPQSSTSQTPLLQQAPPPGYQSPDMKSWQQTGISSNRWETIRWSLAFKYTECYCLTLYYYFFHVAACSVRRDRVQGRPSASRGSTTTWASPSPWPGAPVVPAHYLPWRRRSATVTSTVSSQCAATSRSVSQRQRKFKYTRSSFCRGPCVCLCCLLGSPL